MVAQHSPETEYHDEEPKQSEQTPRRFYRSRRDRMVAGVAGGLAQYFGLDPVLVRLAFVVLMVATGFGLAAYIILAVVTPEIPEGTPEPETAGTFVPPRDGRNVLGFFFIVLGLMWLASNLGWLTFMHWGQMWPVALVFVGVWLLVSRSHDPAV